jgi:hypothetical protein
MGREKEPFGGFKTIIAAQRLGVFASDNVEKDPYG